MTLTFALFVVSVLLLLAGGAMVWADRRRGGRRVAREEPVEEQPEVGLFEPVQRPEKNR